LPNYVLTTEEVGRAMQKVARTGAPKNILESKDIRALLRRWQLSGQSGVILFRVFTPAGSAMSPPKKPDIPAGKLALYEKLIATLPEIERKGAANPYTSLNGHMFSLLLGPKGVMALRLPDDEREKFLKKYKTTLYEAYGAVMKEYVTVSDALLKNTKALEKYLAVSYAHVKTLKPKPSKKKRWSAPALQVVCSPGQL
jgi:hypothetical protein